MTTKQGVGKGDVTENVDMWEEDDTGPVCPSFYADVSSFFFQTSQRRDRKEEIVLFRDYIYYSLMNP